MNRREQERGTLVEAAPKHALRDRAAGLGPGGGSLRVCLICLLWVVTFTGFADEVETRRITMAASPRFLQQQIDQATKLTTLELDDGKQHLSVAWSLGETQFVPAALTTNKVYTFTILEKRTTGITLPQATNSSYEVIRIEADGKALLDLETCEVHHTRMERRALPIVYGLPCPTAAQPIPALAEHRSFPHRTTARAGGCIVMDTFPRSYGAFVCNECDAAFARWLEQHPAKPALDEASTNRQR